VSITEKTLPAPNVREAIAILRTDPTRRVTPVQTLAKPKYNAAPLDDESALVWQVRGGLSLRTEIEQERFRAAAESTARGHDLLDEALVENVAARELIAKLRVMDMEAPRRPTAR
jgi:hypothetical protein